MSARCFLFLWALLALQVCLCNGACAEVDSDTEAVAGKGFKLGCISCKMRGEVEGSAIADWYFRAKGETEFVHIYTYDGESSTIIDDRFGDRVNWNGSKKTSDLQDASIYIHNVTFNDSGVYRCYFRRTLFYTSYEYETTATKLVHLTVVAKASYLTVHAHTKVKLPTLAAIFVVSCGIPDLMQVGKKIRIYIPTRGTASIVSEVMMYVSIIGLQLWLLVEMIYCYRKIAAAGDEALRASAEEYLAIASESKDNCTGVQVAE